jgi:hypothetical protein
MTVYVSNKEMVYLIVCQKTLQVIARFGSATQVSEEVFNIEPLGFSPTYLNSGNLIMKVQGRFQTEDGQIKNCLLCKYLTSGKVITLPPGQQKSFVDCTVLILTLQPELS